MTRIKWYEKYLPFVVQSSEKQFNWLKKELQRSLNHSVGGRSLSLDEIQPYVRLFLADTDVDKQMELTSLLKGLDEELTGQILRAADIYDTITLFGLLEDPGPDHVGIALIKEPPSHEKNQFMITDKLFLAVHNKTSEIMESTVESMQKDDLTSDRFDQAYERFNEMLMDEEVLSLLFPKVKT